MSKNTTNTEDDEVWAELDFNNTALESLLDNPLESTDVSRLRDGTQHQGFDNNMGESWIYPNNLPCRTYQMSIVQAALYRNTMVVLPTGLGKTFIAAVVMYNFYRWYPRGKVIFMAPTRPLVNQQIEACQNIMPFPKKDTIELTGKLPRLKRMEMWKTKRVFFATPQVVQSDIVGGRQQGVDSVDERSFQEAEQTTKTDFPFDLVKLIVIDEAHKAKGKYAYTEVTHILARKTKYFRVLALSATPGRTVEDVAEVCRNLFISHLEVRWDTSFDVLPYVHKRTMETVVVSTGDKIKQIREQLLVIIDPYLRQLTEADVLSGSLTNINRNFLLYEQKRFRDRSFHQGPHPHHSAINTNFAICISLYHALELLERHGLRAFLNSFAEDEDGKSKFVLQMDRRLNNLVENLKKQMGPNPFEFSASPMTNGKIAEIPKDLDFGHPKFEKTRECLLKHFENNKDSRAIVFCEYRESVMLIYRMLLQHVPLLRPRCFVGQGGTGTLRTLTQKQQIQIMNDFRSGKSNILVATSVGEEGLDVGEVELIVCFDISTSNPIRFVQRIGRTGRKKNGYVIMMVTEGREQQLLREVLSNKDQINKKLLKSGVVQQALYKHAPRLVPTEFKPKCIQTFVKPPSDDEDVVSSTKAKKLAKTKKNSPKRTGQDLRKFFQHKPKELDKEDMEFFESGTQVTQAKPGLQTQQTIVKKLDKMKNLFKDLQSSIASQTQKPTKVTPTKLKHSQGSVKDFFIDMNKKTNANDRLSETSNCHQKSFNDSTNDAIDLCADDSDKNQPDIALEEPSTKESDAERLSKLKKFLKTTITTKDVKKRADIKDLGYHLKSKQLSKEMKILLLRERPEFIKEILEHMQVLGALCNNTPDHCTKEEQSIREINQIILELFGGRENAEQFLDKLELDKYKQKCLDSDSESEEEDPQEMNNFHKKLDHLFKGLGGGKKCDNYDWIQQRFKETSFYKDKMKSEVQDNVQASMVYENFVDDENTLNNFDDFSITESKYCSQWQEFNKTDIAYESTPLQASTKGPLSRAQPLKKTSLLTRLAEAKEECEMDEKKNDILNTSGSSRQVQNMLLKLENQLKESSLNETKPASPQDNLAVLESMFYSKPQDNEQHILEAESKILSKNNSENFNLPDEHDLVMAADKAELEFSQNQSKEDKKYSSSLQEPRKTSNSPELKSFVKDDFNVTSTSLNSTPELDLSYSNVKKPEIPSTTSQSQKLPANSGLQYELDIDMEAFMEPFPEEQELLKAMQPSFKRRSFKENLTKATTSDFVRESPDLFAEEHIRSTIKKPIVCREPSVAEKLSANINLKKCQSAVHPAASLTSPHKPLFSTQTPKEQPDSPSSRLTTDKQKYEKSPSLFDMYLKSTKGKGKLPKLLANSSTLTSSVKMTNSVNIPLKDSPVIPASPQNDSVIMLRNRKGIASKRKIFDSDSEHEEYGRQRNDLSVIKLKSNGDDDDSDLEEVAATQRPNETSIFHQRRKRRRFNSFVLQEAGVSGSEKSEDEDEHTVGRYAYDTLVVASDEDDPDQASTSHMQAVYLQSLKSPQRRRGTFKIPAPRVYNDRSRIFSQAVIPEETYSQYLSDSFVVLEEDSGLNESADVSLCPLERAEKILKERRKAKKQSLLMQNCNKSKSKTKTKLPIIEDSSEDDDFE